jgi:hypothetical protein
MEEVVLKNLTLVGEERMKKRPRFLGAANSLKD